VAPLSPGREPVDPVAAVADRAFGSAKWAFLGGVVSRVVSPLLALALARLLVPEDFGIVAVATVVVTLLGLIQPLGLVQALIQRQEQFEAAANVAFGLGLAAGSLLYALLFVLAPLVAEVYELPHLTTVLRWMGLQILFGSLSTVPTAVMQRHFQFRRLFLVQTVAGLLSFAIGIAAALLGLRYWALVAAAVGGSALTAGGLLLLSDWRPRWRFDARLARELGHFGSLVLLEGLLAWALMNLDGAVVAKVLGPRALGLYSVGLNLAMLAMAVPLSAVTGVALSAFSRLQDQRGALGTAYLDGTRMVAAFVIPTGAALALLPSGTTALVLGDRWADLGPLLAILGLYAGFGHLWVLSSDAFKAIGRPDLAPKILAVAAAYQIPVFLLSAPYGLVVFCLARAAVVPVTGPLHTWLAIKHLRLPRDYLPAAIWRPCVAAAAMTGATLAVQHLLRPGPVALSLAVSMPVGLVFYVAALGLLDRPLLQRFGASLRRLYLASEVERPRP
jgi:O-antigen/teichoic acid export membrane protein